MNQIEKKACEEFAAKISKMTDENDHEIGRAHV